MKKFFNTNYFLFQIRLKYLTKLIYRGIAILKVLNSIGKQIYKDKYF